MAAERNESYHVRLLTSSAYFQFFAIDRYSNNCCVERTTIAKVLDQSSSAACPFNVKQFKPSAMRSNFYNLSSGVEVVSDA